MLAAAMPYRGIWKWLPRRKRKRAEAEEEEVGGDEYEFLEVVHLPDVPRPIIFGRRSHLDGKDWICEKCGHLNPTSRHLFVNLPAFDCGRCNVQTRKDFRFSYGNLAANGICLIGKILNQRDTDLCLLFALTKIAELTDRIFTLLTGSNAVIPTLDPCSLKKTFTDSRLAAGIPRNEIDYKDDEALAIMMEIMETIGIQDKKRLHTSKIGGVEQVNGSFEDIVTEIANGYPLLVEIMPGSNFDDLMYGEIYRCPFNNRTIPDERCKGVTTHMMILVGAARLGEIDYFYFLNSYGQVFCFRIRQGSKDEIGGIGKILADDICGPPYKFLRCVL